MPKDFSAEATAGRFPRTRASAVARVNSDDPAERARSFDILVRAYFAPVYKHLRMRWKQEPEQARDLTQGFFARAFEKRWLGDFDANRARFRTYLRTCLDRYVMESERSDRRQKRGGDRLRVSLDFEPAEQELAQSSPGAQGDPEAYFEAEWTRSLLASALDELERRCAGTDKEVRFRVFKRYVLDAELGATNGGDEEQLSYASLAAELGLKPTDVTNHLAWARRELRRIVMDKLCEQTASDEELALEVRRLIGAPP